VTASARAIEEEDTLWLLIALGVIAIVVSGVLTSRYTGGDPDLWEASARRIVPQLVPKWVSLLNQFGWLALLLGVLNLFVPGGRPPSIKAVPIIVILALLITRLVLYHVFGVRTWLAGRLFGGRLTARKPEIAPESWATFALDQLLSAKWESSRERLYDEMRERFPALSSVPNQFFVATILGAQMQVLAFVSVKIGPKTPDLGLAVIIEAQRILEDFRRQNLPLVDAAYTHCNRKLAQYGIGGVSGFKAIADACVELLGAAASPELSGWLEAKFEALGHSWGTDIRRHRFHKSGRPG
jgi:hypothetical protein